MVSDAAQVAERAPGGRDGAERDGRAEHQQQRARHVRGRPQAELLAADGPREPRDEHDDGDDPRRAEHRGEQDDRRRGALEPGGVRGQRGEHRRHGGDERGADEREDAGERRPGGDAVAERPHQSPSRKVSTTAWVSNFEPSRCGEAAVKHDHVAVVAQHVEAVRAHLDRVGAAARGRRGGRPQRLLGAGDLDGLVGVDLARC